MHWMVSSRVCGGLSSKLLCESGAAGRGRPINGPLFEIIWTFNLMSHDALIDSLERRKPADLLESSTTRGSLLEVFWRRRWRRRRFSLRLQHHCRTNEFFIHLVITDSVGVRRALQLVSEQAGATRKECQTSFKQIRRSAKRQTRKVN